MFEMFFTITASLIVALYGLSRSVFMKGPFKNYYRIGLVVFIILIYIVYSVHRYIKHSRIQKMNVHLEDYLYYDKFTSPLYCIGYFLSYLIQNIMFDYTYMRRNFNFCKGLDVYDGGVSEYYIKFRNTWYRYLKLTLCRHRVSLKKLQIFSSETMNDMILSGLETEEEKEMYRVFTKEVENCFKERHLMAEHLIVSIDHFYDIAPYYRKNLLRKYNAILYVEKHEPKIIDMVSRKDLRSQKDINDFKKMKF